MPKDQASLLFTRFEIRGVKLRNRIILPPMCQWQAGDDGVVRPFHLAHYGQCATGGAGMIIVEATAVERRARIRGQDLGLWSDDHVEGMSGLAGVMAEYGAVPAIQLGHAGRKAYRDGTRAVAPSAIAFSEKHEVPDEMTHEDMDTVRQSFVAAAVRAEKAGFRALELHGAHGYLLNQFLSPVSNRRSDEFGGSPEGRLRFPLSVVAAVRQAIKPSTVLMVRVSAVEYTPEGYTLDDMIGMCKDFKHVGVDIVHVSSGGSVSTAPPTWPGYQLGFARAIRNAVGIPVIGVGLVNTPDLAEFAVREGFCDLIAIGREMLRNPNFPLHAARQLGAALPFKRGLRRALERAFK
jgi:NADPH2 dehydrogenase